LEPELLHESTMLAEKVLIRVREGADDHRSSHLS
jgi:hypothetical protein